jgi:hypothetical protein
LTRKQPSNGKPISGRELYLIFYIGATISGEAFCSATLGGPRASTANLMINLWRGVHRLTLYAAIIEHAQECPMLVLQRRHNHVSRERPNKKKKKKNRGPGHERRLAPNIFLLLAAGSGLFKKRVPVITKILSWPLIS